MSSPEKFKLLRSILNSLGLSKEAVDDIVERISDLKVFSTPAHTQVTQTVGCLSELFLVNV
jgi:hypothetical protein